ncbi:MAG: response regulator [Deltaproteobacteria bacterium]|nr:MAG: response regulator [Deltaproteobacteria bacterium]
MTEVNLHHVLLIDDEEGIRKVMSIALRDAGYVVWIAESGEQGMEIFERELPALVLTDIKMPGMDGIEVLRRIKEMETDSEVIIITGHGEMELAISALQLEASDFITKPIHDEALFLALKRAEEKISLKIQLRDYTENLERKVKEATAEIQRISDFQANLIDNSLDGIVAGDEQRKVVIFNDSAQRLTGYKEEEVVGRLTLEDLYEKELVDHWLSRQRLEEDSSSDEISTHLDTTIQAREGRKIPIRLTHTILRQEGQKVGCVTFFQDLREIRRLERKLVQSERLAATGQTAASIAHAIKNIVGGLKGGMFVVNKGFELSNENYLQDGWDMVQRNIAKISSLAMDLLTFSKERQPDYRLAQVNDVAAEVVELLKKRGEEFGIKLSLETADGLEPVAMDVTGIHQCLVNLVSNAIDACRPEICGHEQGRVTLSTCTHPGWAVCFEVKDNGCGITAKDKEKLFTTFFSTKGADGTGLGLLNVQKIAKEHGGHIEVESVPAEGSTFRLLLPSGPNKEGESLYELDGKENDNKESHSVVA